MPSYIAILDRAREQARLGPAESAIIQPPAPAPEAALASPGPMAGLSYSQWADTVLASEVPAMLSTFQTFTLHKEQQAKARRSRQ